MPGKKKRQGPSRRREPASTPAWMVTYGDMVTLLLTFFVLLISLSTLDLEKMREVVVSFDSSFGFFSKAPDSAPTELDLDRATSVFEFPEIKRHDIKKRLEEDILEADMADVIEVAEGPEGIVLRIKDRVLFNLGKAELTPMAWPIVNKIADLLKGIPYDTRIEGHTDNLPIHTRRYPSNWELSAARAITVARSLIAQGEMDPSRIWAMGYGEFRPLVPNTSDENRAMNRRVEIILMEKVQHE